MIFTPGRDTAPGLPLVTRRDLPGRLVSGLTRTSIASRDRSLGDDTEPIPPAGLDLHRRAVCDGLHRILYLPDPAIRLFARHERRRDRHAGWRALAARSIPVDPCWRADGPVRDTPGDIVLCLDGDGAGASLSAGTVVLAITAVAGRQWRRTAVCLVGLTDLDRSAGRRRGRIYRPIQLLRANRHHAVTDGRRCCLGLGWRMAGLHIGCRLGRDGDDRATTCSRGGVRRGWWAALPPHSKLPSARRAPAIS